MARSSPAASCPKSKPVKLSKFEIAMPQSPSGNFVSLQIRFDSVAPWHVDSPGASMWTTKNRARYERKGLRYESDLTDEEYALIEPFSAAGVTSHAALSSAAFCTCSPPVASGGNCRRIFCPRARRTTTLSSFNALACSQEFTTHSMPRCGY